MKKIGIVGGVAWISTVDYYTGICRRSKEWHAAGNLPGPPSTPEMVIESLDHNKAVAYLGVEGDEESWRQFDEYHRAALLRLEMSGADFALIASNTPHHRFESIVRGVTIPVLDIFEVVAKESAHIGASGVLILGTAVTMSSARFREAFSRHGIQAVSPADAAARRSTIELIQDLQLGKLEGAAERLAAIAEECYRQFNRQPLVCLACTELPCAFPEQKMFPFFGVDNTVYINAAILHANAAFNFAVVTA
ncbi:MAG TPA: aspartate/glutamate racemase family protein [Bryobacteraceae bacterium]|nr:aspartate/glutamate racemase family protein [Bryobacteraceae bacterium]